VSIGVFDPRTMDDVIVTVQVGCEFETPNIVARWRTEPRRIMPQYSYSDGSVKVPD
jgi:hypothetical protein